MQLYILGPAFGIASIDSESLAAVVLLRLRVDKVDWCIRPSYNVDKRLPHLIDGDQHIYGFNNISRYIDERFPTPTELTQAQRADSIALTSFLNTHAQILLDISLYVSFENYTTTRSAFTKILPWHANYILPPRLREAARKRTEHLGISSIDVEDVHDDVMNRPQGFDTSVGTEKTFEAETQKRASLLLPQRNTVRGLLQQKQGAAVFKLHALADNFFDVLSEMLGKKQYFLGGDEPTTVDCLAYGYLSLMLYPQLPQRWLSKTMWRKYSNLASFTERMHNDYRLWTDAESVMSLANCGNEQEVAAAREERKLTLPWALPASAGVLDVAHTIAVDLISRNPLLGSRPTIIATTLRKPTFWQNYWPTFLLTTVVTLSSFGYYALATGLLVWPHGEETHIFGRRRLADYGHLGAALAGVSLLGQQAARTGQWQEEQMNASPVRVEVEVEKDGVP